MKQILAIVFLCLLKKSKVYTLGADFLLKLLNSSKDALKHIKIIPTSDTEN